MAHELANHRNGGKAMFSVKETPWHREGTLLHEAPDLATALDLAGHDFDVKVRPVYVERPVSNGTDTVMEKVQGYGASTRIDTDQVLGIVGGRYTPLQNRDAFGVLEPLLDSGLATLETGGTLRGGRDVWMLARFNVDHPVVQEVFADEVVPFGLISNNHTGARQVIVQNTPIRVVCANTLGMALDSSRTPSAIKVRHTSSVQSKTVEAAETLWKGIVERMVQTAHQYQALRTKYIRAEQFERAVLDVLAPLPELPPKPTGRQEGALMRAKIRRERLIDLRSTGDGHVGDGYAWEAYNAVVQSLDHDEDLWRVRGGERTQAMAFGRLGEMKARVLRNLIRVA